MTRIGITSGMSGYFAVLYDVETMEPIQTGIGRYRTKEEAANEAVSWAKDEGVSVEKAVNALLERSV